VVDTPFLKVPVPSDFKPDSGGTDIDVTVDGHRGFIDIQTGYLKDPKQTVEQLKQFFSDDLKKSVPDAKSCGEATTYRPTGTTATGQAFFLCGTFTPTSGTAFASTNWFGIAVQDTDQGRLLLFINVGAPTTTFDELVKAYPFDQIVFKKAH
jgi:hypothetical protein